MLSQSVVGPCAAGVLGHMQEEQAEIQETLRGERFRVGL